MKEKVTGALYFVWILVIASCVYNSEEELYPMECDAENVTYLATIAPIIDLKCSECHSGSNPLSGIRLDNYHALKTQVDAGRLIGSIRHQNGFIPMPENRSPLPECEILQIEKWVNDGAPNN